MCSFRSIEAPAITLKYIQKYDPEWIKKLSNYIKDSKIEFIGSGYSQIIGPLVPAKVNEWNQKIGQKTYKKILNINPKIALVNEMAFSAGIIEHYLKSGYEAIIMEWNNPRLAHPEWENEWRYHLQLALGTEKNKIPIIWSDSIAFQKLQRYVHNDLSFEKYLI